MPVRTVEGVKYHDLLEFGMGRRHPLGYPELEDNSLVLCAVGCLSCDFEGTAQGCDFEGTAQGCDLHRCLCLKVVGEAVPEHLKEDWYEKLHHSADGEHLHKMSILYNQLCVSIMRLQAVLF